MVYLDCLLLVFASVQILIKYFFVFFSRALSCAFFLAYWFFLCCFLYSMFIIYFFSFAKCLLCSYVCLFFCCFFLLLCVKSRCEMRCRSAREDRREEKEAQKKSWSNFFLVVNLYRDHSKLWFFDYFCIQFEILVRFLRFWLEAIYPKKNVYTYKRLKP